MRQQGPRCAPRAPGPLFFCFPPPRRGAGPLTPPGGAFSRTRPPRHTSPVLDAKAPPSALSPKPRQGSGPAPPPLRPVSLPPASPAPRPAPPPRPCGALPRGGGLFPCCGTPSPALPSPPPAPFSSSPPPRGRRGSLPRQGGAGPLPCAARQALCAVRQAPVRAPSPARRARPPCAVRQAPVRAPSPARRARLFFPALWQSAACNSPFGPPKAPGTPPRCKRPPPENPLFLPQVFFALQRKKKGAPARGARAGGPFFLFPCKTRAGRRRGVLFSLFLNFGMPSCTSRTRRSRSLCQPAPDTV